MVATQKEPCELSARDLMREVAVTIPEQMTLTGAARLLAQWESSAAPVTDAEGRCVGVLSLSALAPWAANEHSEGRENNSPSTCAWTDWQVMEDEVAPEDEVRHHMSEDPPLTASEASLEELVHALAETGASRVIVVDAQRRPVGMVSAAEVLTAAYERGKHSFCNAERGGEDEPLSEPVGYLPE